jgi:hypothetical protein
MLFCTNCGTPTGGEDKKFCTKCGAVLPGDPPADEAPTAITTPPSFPPDLPAAPPDLPATVTAGPFAVPPVPAAPEPPPSYVSPPGSWPPSQPAAPSYDAPAGSWPTAQAPGYDPTGPGAWPPAQPQDFPPPRQPGPPDPSPRPNHTAAWIGFAVAAVLVLAGGGFAAWKFLGHSNNNHPAAAGSSTGPANQTGSGSSGSPAANSPSPLPTTSSALPTTPGSGGGFPVAAAAAAAQQPGEQQVISFLQSYFTAINNHDYGQYASLVSPSQRPTPAVFENGYGTTTDSNATLTGLVPYGTGVAAAVKFTSNQSPSASPDGASCDAWHITLFLQPHGSGYRVGPAAPDYHARYRAC